jgi:Cu2+-containing amine oxidase
MLKEVHDDGLRWVSGYANTSGENRGYRGEKLVLVAGFQAVNYVYLTEYHFTDDGRIVCRLGFTAHNIVPRGKKNNIKDGDVHLHVGCWRMDFDLSDTTNPDNPIGGQADNDYRLLSRRFDKDARRFKQVDEAFGGGPEAREGKAEWKAKEFTTLRVLSTTVRNAHKRQIAYDLIPSRLGSVRGLLSGGDVANEDMDFINSDFFITHAPAAGPMAAYHKVPALAAQQQPLRGNAATVWYSSPALHVPRGEDFGGQNGITNTLGLALTSWIEFTLRPRDLCDGTPLYSSGKK